MSQARISPKARQPDDKTGQEYLKDKNGEPILRNQELKPIPERDQPPAPPTYYNDPLQDLFGPESKAKYIGNPEDSVPDEILAVLVDNGLGNRQFQAILKEIPKGANGQEPGDYVGCSDYIKGFNSVVPSTEWIARTYGPGAYLLSFNWTTQNGPHGQIVKERHRENCIINISDKFMDEYKQCRLDRKLKMSKEANEKVSEAILERKLDSELTRETGLGPVVDPKDAAKAYLTEALETARLLGLGPQKGIEWDKILPIAVPAILAFLQSQQSQSREMMQLMLTISGQNNNQLLELAKINQGQGQGGAMFKEMKDMLMGAIDLKAAITPERESVADKIFKVVEGVLPQILQIATMKQQERTQDFRYKFAQEFIKQDPNFQQVMKDPVARAESINKLDEHFGWEQTDQVLAVAGIERPDSCPRDPAKQFPKDHPSRLSEEQEEPGAEIEA
jgi:hypothetical protein